MLNLAILSLMDTTREGSLSILVAPLVGISRGINYLLDWMLVNMFQLMLGLTGPQLLSRAYFLPGVFVNSLKVRISDKFKWYDRIDDTVVLGALPFRSQAEEVATVSYFFNMQNLYH